MTILKKENFLTTAAIILMAISAIILPGQVKAYCGDGVLDTGEVCDGSVFRIGSSSCNNYYKVKATSNYYYEGSLSCNKCRINSSKCKYKKGSQGAAQSSVQTKNPAATVKNTPTQLSSSAFSFANGQKSALTISDQTTSLGFLFGDTASWVDLKYINKETGQIYALPSVFKLKGSNQWTTSLNIAAWPNGTYELSVLYYQMGVKTSNILTMILARGSETKETNADCSVFFSGISIGSPENLNSGEYYFMKPFSESLFRGQDITSVLKEGTYSSLCQAAPEACKGNLNMAIPEGVTVVLNKDGQTLSYAGPLVINEQNYTEYQTPSWPYSLDSCFGLKKDGWGCQLDSIKTRWQDASLTISCIKPGEVACGSAAKEYVAGESAWPSNAVFCVNGNANPLMPTFPTATAAASWICTSSDGKTTKMCSATIKKDECRAFFSQMFVGGGSPEKVPFVNPFSSQKFNYMNPISDIVRGPIDFTYYYWSTSQFMNGLAVDKGTTLQISDVNGKELFNIKGPAVLNQDYDGKGGDFPAGYSVNDCFALDKNTWSCQTCSGRCLHDLGAFKVKITCDQSTKVIDCGAANGKNLATAPNKDLCSPEVSPLPMVFDLGDKWQWTCGQKICEASKIKQDDKVITCGASSGKTFATAPTKDLCSPEALPLPSLSDLGDRWQWICGQATCQALKAKVDGKVDGKCGSAHLKVYEATQTVWPTGDTFCDPATTISGKEPIFPGSKQTATWICKGTNGGADVGCWAKRKEAVAVKCGAAHATYSNSAPTKDLCSPEVSPLPTVYEFDTWWQWNCGQLTCQTFKKNVQAECGSAHLKVYDNNQTAWPQGDTFCKPTTALVGREPAFPGEKQTATWTCFDSAKGTSVGCWAKRRGKDICGQPISYDGGPADSAGSFSGSQKGNYRTTPIGSLCWMIDNLNTGTMLNATYSKQNDNGILEKWCYFNDNNSCSLNRYGGLYMRDEAAGYGSKDICPSGWRLPTTAEWQDAIRLISADAGLFAKFNIMPSGQFRSETVGFQHLGFDSHFWLGDETKKAVSCYGGAKGYCSITNDDFSVMKNYNNQDYGNGLSVRCVRNAGLN